MTEAYRCDWCDEYHEGDPAKKLYEKESGHGGTNYYRAADLCEECTEMLEEGEEA